MRVTIDIDDEVYEALRRRVTTPAKKATDADVRKHIKNVLAEFGTLGEKADRYFVVHGEMRRELEKIVQTTIETADQLVRDVRKLSLVKIGTVERALTDSEVMILAEQAGFFGVSPDEHIKNTVDEALHTALGTF